jgi:hypothetical protein
LNYVKLVEKKTVHKKCHKKQEREMCNHPTGWLVGVGKFIAEMGERRGVGAM